MTSTPKQQRWWETLPACLAGAAALVTAIGGTIVVVRNDPSPDTKSLPRTESSASQAKKSALESAQTGASSTTGSTTVAGQTTTSTGDCAPAMAGVNIGGDFKSDCAVRKRD
jgi:hypothetical protein